MTRHVAIPVDLVSRRCVTCGEWLEGTVYGPVVAGQANDPVWRHVDPSSPPVDVDRPTQLGLEDANGVRRVCAICGEMARPGYLVEPAMTALDPGLWANRAPTKVPDYRTLNVCRRRQACRDRLEAHGGTWPLIEGDLSRTVRNVASPKPPAPAPDADPLDAFG